jgi:hypothetical protein
MGRQEDESLVWPLTGHDAELAQMLPRAEGYGDPLRRATRLRKTANAGFGE